MRRCPRPRSSVRAPAPPRTRKFSPPMALRISREMAMPGPPRKPWRRVTGVPLTSIW